MWKISEKKKKLLSLRSGGNAQSLHSIPGLQLTPEYWDAILDKVNVAPKTTIVFFVSNQNIAYQTGYANKLAYILYSESDTGQMTQPGIQLKLRLSTELSGVHQ